MPRSLEPSVRAEIVIGIPPIEVWRAFTDPEHLSYWLGDASEVDLRVGGAYVVRGPGPLLLDTTVEKMAEGRRLVLRPTRRGDDARIEVDLIKLAGAGTRVAIADGDPGNNEAWRSALENLRSVWETGADLRAGGEAPPTPAALIRRVGESIESSGARFTTAVDGLSDEDAYCPDPGRGSIAHVLASASLEERLAQCRLDEAARGRRPARSGPAAERRAWVAAILEDAPGVAALLGRVRQDQRETAALVAHWAAQASLFKPRWGCVASIAIDLEPRRVELPREIERIRETLGL